MTIVILVEIYNYGLKMLSSRLEILVWPETCLMITIMLQRVVKFLSDGVLLRYSLYVFIQSNMLSTFVIRSLSFRHGITRNSRLQVTCGATVFFSTKYGLLVNARLVTFPIIRSTPISTTGHIVQ